MHALGFGFYALLQVVSPRHVLMPRHMISHRQAPDMPRRALTDTSWQSGALMLGFGLSIPVFFVTS